MGSLRVRFVKIATAAAQCTAMAIVGLGLMSIVGLRPVVIVQGFRPSHGPCCLGRSFPPSPVKVVEAETLGSVPT